MPCHSPEDGILRSYRREHFKSCFIKKYPIFFCACRKDLDGPESSRLSEDLRTCLFRLMGFPSFLIIRRCVSRNCYIVMWLKTLFWQHLTFSILSDLYTGKEEELRARQERSSIHWKASKATQSTCSVRNQATVLTGY
jgi:hypothetical protein